MVVAGLIIFVSPKEKTCCGTKSSATLFGEGLLKNHVKVAT
jgi:hypothetical protein